MSRSAITNVYRLALVAITGVMIAAVALQARAQVAMQPMDKNSFLIQNDGRGIRDDDFAMIMRNRLIMNGMANVRDAKFAFAQCFGGGMLDDLDRAFGNVVRWVGGAASRWDQPSVGQVSKSENDARPMMMPPKPKYGAIWESDPLPPRDFWSMALVDDINQNPNRSLLQSFNSATANDRVGVNAAPPYPKAETGQSIAKNGGDMITLKDPDAASHHAILWAGAPDARRHFNDIMDTRNALINAWGNPANNPNVSIKVLFGNGMNFADPADPMGMDRIPLPMEWGAMPATRDSLVMALDMLPLNSNEEFFFYASDHGGDSTTIQAPPNPPRRILPRERDLERFVLAQGELDGMLLDDKNIATLTVEYSGVTTAGVDSVMFNDVLLGYLNPALSEMEFVVPESALSLSDDVLIVNNDLSAIDIRGKRFFTGAIGTNPVPEPSTVMLLVAAAVFGLCRAIALRTRCTS